MTHTLPQLLPHCQHSHFCGPCRDREQGQAFRAGVLERQGIEGVDVDFDCPKKKPWKSRGRGDTIAKGIGDHFHDLLTERYGIPACSRCREIIDEMNTLGRDGCWEHRDRIINDMWGRRGQLKGWRAVAAKLPAIETLAKMELATLMNAAIRRYNRGQS
jgi:hypothetical protein